MRTTDPERDHIRKGGRHRVMTPAKLETARNLYDTGKHTVAQIAGILGVSRATVHHVLAEQVETAQASA